MLAFEKPRGESMARSFLLDVLVRVRAQAILAELRETNLVTWRKMIEGHGEDRVIDPDTLERLRGLGYVNGEAVGSGSHRTRHPADADG